MRFILPLAVLLLACTVAAQAPDFEPAYQLLCNGTIIDVGYYAAPSIVDWDGDGINDMILGQFTSGYIRFYKNVGTNDSPLFTSFSYLQADGINITMGSG
jgi:hypothetical protein